MDEFVHYGRLGLKVQKWLNGMKEYKKKSKILEFSFEFIFPTHEQQTYVRYFQLNFLFKWNIIEIDACNIEVPRQQTNLKIANRNISRADGAVSAQKR